MERSIGEEIEVKLFKPIDKQKVFCGKLIKYDKEKIYIELDSEEKSIERNLIAQIKIKFEW